ncbi:MAG: hypothetical protein GY737_07270, partial [Desulfobacteraceae bacterium]|nr:hypothetical protein [Desulfobacteraceae bacterium]
MVLDHYAFVVASGEGHAVLDLALMKNTSNNNCVLGFNNETFLMDAEVYLKKEQVMGEDEQGNPVEQTEERVIGVQLVNRFGIKLVDLTQTVNNPDFDPTQPASKPRTYNTLSSHSPASSMNPSPILGGLEVVTDYPVTEKDAAGEIIEVKKDLVFFSVVLEQRLLVIDITNPGYPQLFREIRFDDVEGIHDIEVDAEDRVLYFTDSNLGLVTMDITFSWDDAFVDSSRDRILGIVAVIGSANQGLVIDKELNIAYVGKWERGLEAVKLGNPTMRLVWKDDTGQYHPVTQIAPTGIKSAD